MSEEWFIYRFMIDDRIYFVVRDLTLTPVPPGSCFVGWIRSDGMEFGGNFRVWARWLPAMTSHATYRIEVKP